MDKHIYKLIAFKDGKKCILAEYRGDTDGLYNFQIERVETKSEKRCSDTGVSCGQDACSCDAKC